MNTTGFKEVAEGLGALLAAASIVSAVALFLWKREWRPRITFDLGVDAFTKVGNSFLVEPVCVVENKGLLRCYIHRLQMSVRYLSQGDPLEFGDESLLFATKFPHRALRADFVKPEWSWSYVEAGIRVRYSHVIHIPADTVALLVWVKVFHKKNVEDDFFSAQRVLVVVGDQVRPARLAEMPAGR